MAVHCWAEPPEGGSTCMLLDGHDGPHEFTPDSEIQIAFAPFDETVPSEGTADG